MKYICFFLLKVLWYLDELNFKESVKLYDFKKIFIILVTLHVHVVFSNVTKDSLVLKKKQDCGLSYEQYFCPSNPRPTVADLLPIPNQINPNQWFESELSSSPLNLNTPLQTGTYYAEIPGNSINFTKSFFTNDIQLTTAITQLVDTKVLIASSIVNWFTYEVRNRIFIYNSDQTNKTFFSNVPGLVTSILELSNGEILVSIFDTREIIRISRNGINLGVFISNGEIPYKMLKTLSNEILVIYNGEQILKYDENGNYLGVFANGLSQASDLIQKTTGDVVVVDKGGDEVIIYNINGVVQSRFLLPYPLAEGIDILTNGNFVISFLDGFIVEFSPDGRCYNTIANNLLGLNEILVLRDQSILTTDRRASDSDMSIGNVRRLTPIPVSYVRIPVTIEIYNIIIPSIPDKVFCYGATISDLSTTFTNIKWYKSETGGIELERDEILETGYYYLSATINNCESLLRRRVFVRINYNIFSLFQEAISVSGHTHDIVAQTLPPSNSITRGFNQDGNCLISSSFPGAISFMPTTNLVESNYSGITYILEDYNKKNSFSLFKDESVTINLIDRISNTKVLYMLAGSSSKELKFPRVDIRVNFTDGSYEEFIDKLVYDWESSTLPYAIKGLGMYQSASGLSNSLENAKLFDIVLPLAEINRLKVITSIRVTHKGSNQDAINILALSRTLERFDFNLTVCNGKKISDVKQIPSSLLWYDTMSSTLPLSRDSILESRTYYVSMQIENCETERYAVNIDLNTLVTASPISYNQVFCSVATVSDLVTQGTAIKWYSNVNLEQPLIPSTHLTTGVYYVTQTINDCESEPTQVNVTVNNFNLNRLATGLICINPQTNQVVLPYHLEIDLPIEEYDFKWFRNDENLLEESNSILVGIPGNYYVIVRNRITGCTKISNVTNVSSSFVAESIQVNVNNSLQYGKITVVVEGSGNYLYQIDNSGYQESNVFNNVLPGVHTIEVKDLEGCTYKLLEVQVLSFPNFFTPNGDGIHDTWNIWSLAGQEDTEIFIFDRQGMFIKQIDSSGLGWDGTYNGVALPSTDYWFTVKYRDGLNQEFREFKSHFSLKR